MPDYPVYTRKVHTDVSYLACARRLLAATDVIYPQFATHNAQTVAAILAAGRASRRDGYEFQCLHGMGETLYDQVVGADEPGPARAASMRRSARTRRCSPTWCAACWRTAPTPRSSTGSSIRASALERLLADPVDGGARRAGWPAAPAHPAAARTCIGAERRNSAGIDLSDEATRLPQLAGACASSSRQHERAHAPPLALARARRARVACDAQSRPTATTQRRHACVEAAPADVDARARSAAAASRRNGRACPPPTRAAHARARRRRARARTRRADVRWPCAKPASRCRMRSAKCARRSTSCAITRRRRARRASMPNGAPLGAGRLHQPVELPAGDLHRPGRGRARRRQRGARQTGRADAADRRARACACCTRPACPRAALQLLPGARRVVGAALVARRARARRDLHRLDRGRAGDQRGARCARRGRNAAGDPV